MSRSTTQAAPTAKERLANLEAERERVLSDLGEARERHKSLRASRVEALGGTPDSRAARALDADLLTARNDVETLEDLIEDLQPRLLELRRLVGDEERAVSRRQSAERTVVLTTAQLEIAAHMDAIRAIADQHTTGAFGPPFSRSACAVVRLARSHTWTLALPDELRRTRERAHGELAALEAEGR